MENLNSYQFTTLSDISNLSFLFNLVCTPCTLNFVTVKTNIKRKKEAIVQLEQEIVDEETKIKSLEYLLKNIENAKGDINE